MKKGTFLGLAVVLAAGGAVSALLLGKRGEAAEARETAGAPSGAREPVPADPDKTVAFPLKDKYADYSSGQDDPVYRFSLDTPAGVREITVDKTQYETYYIGDEVVCVETGSGLQIL